MKTLTRLLAVLTFAGWTGGVNAGLILSLNVDSLTQLSYEISGTIDGPLPNPAAYVLFADIFDGVSDSNMVSHVGTFDIGGQGLNSSFVGYDNQPYGNTIQFRTSGDMLVGDVASGAGLITYSNAHGLNQNMFDGFTTELFWGRNGGVSQILQGPSQGFVASIDPQEPPSGVPAPATFPLFFIGLAGLGWSRRKKA